MPGLFAKKQDPEAAPWGPGADPSDAELSTHALTQELLDWLIAALTAVVSTPQVRNTQLQRAKQSLTDALKHADHFYPMTLEVPDAAEVREGQGLVLGLEGSLQDPGEGGPGSASGVRARVQEEGE